MASFGDLKVRVGPWDVEYGSETQTGYGGELGPEEVSLDVEVPTTKWQPVTPSSARLPPRLVFVDGVRRLEVRLLVKDGGQFCHGAFGSFAVGSAVVTEGVARHDQALVGRLVVVGSGRTLPSSISPMPGLVYRPSSTVDSEPDGPLRAIHNEMRLAEERLARSLSDAEGSLVVADGPLSFEDPVRGSVVGYVKSLFKLYLPQELQPLLARLTPGSRTPLFGLRATERFSRYSWFLRLARAQAADSELSGLVRLEVSEAIGFEQARRLADASAHFLPRFAPSRARDPRAPQNLLPIGALESHLRRRLGDSRLIRRHVESLIAAEVASGSGLV
jgi:uncharacterized protein